MRIEPTGAVGAFSVMEIRGLVIGMFASVVKMSLDIRQQAPELEQGGSIRWVEQVEIPARPEYVGVVRRRVVQLVRDAGFTEGEGIDIAVAVSEAISNAIEHARPGEGDAVVDVTCAADTERVKVTVRDNGRVQWKPEDVPPEMDPLEAFDEVSQRGRGLINMRAFMDELSIHVTETGTEVQLIKHRKSIY